MGVRQTSLEAYRKISESNKDHVMQRKVFNALISLRQATDSEISFYLMYSDPNKIRPRRNELVKKGIVKSIGKRVCEITGRECILWSVTQNHYYDV